MGGSPAVFSLSEREREMEISYLAELIKVCILGVLIITESELMDALRSLELFKQPESRIEQRI